LCPFHRNDRVAHHTITKKEASKRAQSKKTFSTTIACLEKSIFFVVSSISLTSAMSAFILQSRSGLRAAQSKKRFRLLRAWKKVFSPLRSRLSQSRQS